MTMSITKGHTRLIPCSLHSDCKNVQKSALKSVNVQRTGKSILQMFAFSFFDGSHICRFLPILRPPTVPRSIVTEVSEIVEEFHDGARCFQTKRTKNRC